MDFYRVGDKLISRSKLDKTIERILDLRASGMSQQEVAHKVNVDRTFISRLEAIAEIRKGGALAVIGFPIGNKEEISAIAQEMGVEFTFLMTDEERWNFIQSLSGQDFLNYIMELMTRLRDFDSVIMIGSDMRIRLAEVILGGKVIGVELGKSPIEGDVYFEPEDFREIIAKVKGADR